MFMCIFGIAIVASMAILEFLKGNWDDGGVVHGTQRVDDYFRYSGKNGWIGELMDELKDDRGSVQLSLGFDYCARGDHHLIFVDDGAWCRNCDYYEDDES